MVSRYGSRVYGFVVYYLGNRQGADDVMQEVLIKFWNRRHEVDTDRIVPWLMTVARNACIDEHRRKKNRRDSVTYDTDMVGDMADFEGERGDSAIESQLFMEDLTAEIERLDDPFKSIVILREIQGMKYEEIAESMDLPLSSGKVYLHRARKKLRQNLSTKLEINHAG